jgi:glyoxylase-like metal-dependent hydrolase (beta-lactamase superfamily II)
MKRRRFLQVLSSLSFSPAFATSGLAFRGPASSPFEAVTPSVLVYRDAVNVGLIRRHGRLLLIDSGDASVLQFAQKAGVGSVDWVLYTSHQRDHCSGAELLKKAGVKIAVPEGEVQFFRDATEFWQNADKLINYAQDFRPDLSVLRNSVLPDRVLRPGEVFRWEDLEIHVVATPGMADGAVSYELEVDGTRVTFTGDLICGPGKIWEFSKLQKPFPDMVGDYGSGGHGGYWAFGGAVPELKRSLQEVLSWRPDVLVPAHGPVMRNPAEAVALLNENLDRVMRNYLTLAAWRLYFKEKEVDTGYPDVPMLPPPPAPTAPAWLHRVRWEQAWDRVETSWYIRAPNGRIFLFDCGWYPVLPAIHRLLETGEIKGIDGVWVSHYHDDHVVSVNAIARDYGAKVYAQKEVVDILENPLAYQMPCLFPERIYVDHPLTEGEVLDWNGYKMTAYYFPGQTVYHDGLLIEHDGTRIFMSGDSFSNFGIDDYCSYNRNFLGGDEPGYQQCIRLLLKLKPDMLVAAHFGPVPFAETNLRKALALLQERRDLMARLCPWDDPNFCTDPGWVRAYPFRQTALPGQLVTLEARILNHSASAHPASAELNVPSGWKITDGRGKIDIPPHTEGRIRLTSVAPPIPQFPREILGITAEFESSKLGEIAVAIVDFAGQP